MTMFKLGKLPHVPGAISWKYRDIFNPKKLQKPPLVFGHVWNETVVQSLGNDIAGDCVWATQAHVLQCMQRGVGRPETHFDQKSVLSDYSAVTGYVRGDDSTDNGTQMGDAASYWRKTGLVDANGERHKIEAYVDLRITDTDELMQACFDFGGIALGVNLPQSAQTQWSQRRPWTYESSKSKILGGHAVLLAGRNHNGSAVIATWNGITSATMEWVEAYADEAVAFFSLDYLDEKGLNPRGYDRAELQRRLAAL